MKSVLSSGNVASLPSQRYTRCVLSSKQASAAVSLAGESYRGIIQGYHTPASETAALACLLDETHRV